jgi:hypothetical protein
MFLVRTFYTKSQIIDNAYQTLVIYNLFSGYSDTHIIDNRQLSIMSVTDPFKNETQEREKESSELNFSELAMDR